MDRMLRRREVESVTSLSRSSIYQAMAEGRFPKPVRLGHRAVGWRKSVIDDWLANRTPAGPRSSSR
jgi:prophage regulatory protein